MALKNNKFKYTLPFKFILSIFFNYLRNPRQSEHKEFQKEGAEGSFTFFASFQKARQ